MGGQCLQLPIQVLADQLTLYQPKGNIVNTTLLIAQPALGSFLRPCMQYTPLEQFWCDFAVSRKASHLYVGL